MLQKVRVPFNGAASGFFATGTLTGAASGGAAALGGTLASSGLAASGLGAVAAGAIGGVAGSIASQAFGVATGIQDKFSWNAVALAGISGAIGGAGKLGVGGEEWYSVAARGAVANVASQGVAIAAGLQDKFSWSGVATAGVIAGAAKFASDKLPGAAFEDAKGYRPPTRPNVVASRAAGAIAGAGARSLIEGSDFGDNVMAALPDVIGQTIGEAVAGKIAQGMENARVRRAEAEKAQTFHASGWSRDPRSYDADGNPIGDPDPNWIEVEDSAAAERLRQRRAEFEELERQMEQIQSSDDLSARLRDLERIPTLGREPPSQDPRARMYAEYLAGAAEANPGPPMLDITGGRNPMYVPEIPGTNFAGNGGNDLANISYALARTYGMEKIIINDPVIGESLVNVDSFLNPDNYNPSVASAMRGVILHYWSDVGYDPNHPGLFDRANDWAHAVPTREVDMAALRHDFSEIWFAGNPRMQMAVNRDLMMSSYAAAAIDYSRGRYDWAAIDLDIAHFAIAAGYVQGAQAPRPQQPPVRPRP